MAGIKRKSVASAPRDPKVKSKKVKVDKSTAKRPAEHNAAKQAQTPTKTKLKVEPDGLVESDTSEDENGFYGFSADNTTTLSSSDGSSADEPGASSEPDKKEGNKGQKKKLKNDDKKTQKASVNEKKPSKLAELNGTPQSSVLLSAGYTDRIVQQPHRVKPMPSRKPWLRIGKPRNQTPMPSNEPRSCGRS